MTKIWIKKRSLSVCGNGIFWFFPPVHAQWRIQLICTYINLYFDNTFPEINLRNLILYNLNHIFIHFRMHVTVLNLTLVNTCTCMSESMKENFLCTHLHLPKSRPFLTYISSQTEEVQLRVLAVKIPRIC